MATEPERYLRKARESLASAQADVRAKRYNSAANRAYYAAFQAAVAALISYSVKPEGRNWEHRYVNSQFSGKLIWRRELFKSGMAEVLDKLFDVRINADYKPDPVSAKHEERSVRVAREFVEEIEGKLTSGRLKEPTAIYGEATIPARENPEDYVELVKEKILETYPDMKFETYRRGPRDFTLEVVGDLEDMWDVQDVLGALKADILVQHDVWIVLSPRRLNADNN